MTFSTSSAKPEQSSELADTIDTYRIADEPRPRGMARFTVNPLWPFLVITVFGGLPGFVWFALNAFAVGSATKYRQLWVVILGIIVYLLLFYTVVTVGRELSGQMIQPYLLIIPVLWRLGCGYVLYMWQCRDVELFERFGDGKRYNGFAGFFAALFLVTMLGQLETSVMLAASRAMVGS